MTTAQDKIIMECVEYTPSSSTKSEASTASYFPYIMGGVGICFLILIIVLIMEPNPYQIRRD